MAIWIALGVVALVVAGDVGYSTVTTRRLARWEAGIERNDDGVRRGCEAFSVGEGRTALLMVHGFADSPALWRRMAPRLAQRGFACRAMRLPHFAEPMADYARTDVDQWRTALAGELAALRREHDAVWVVAHSMGGALAVEQALEHPDTVDGLVLLAPLLKVSSRRSPLLSPAAWHKVSGALLHVSRVVESTFPVDAHDPELVQTYPRDVFVPRVVYEGLFELIGSIRGRAGEIRCPVFMALSKDDLVVDWEAAAGYHDAMGTDDKTRVYVEDAGHVLPQDRGWEDLAARVAGFVAARTAPGD